MITIVVVILPNKCRTQNAGLSKVDHGTQVGGVHSYIWHCLIYMYSFNIIVYFWAFQNKDSQCYIPQTALLL